MDVQIEHLRLEYSVGGYEAAARAAGGMASTYDAIAELIGADAADVAFTDGATRAWNHVLLSADIGPGDVVLSARTEFASNLVSLAQVARARGATVVLAGTDPDGRISLDDVHAALDDRVALVAVSHVPMHLGVVNPVARIGAAVRAQGRAVYLLDGCQSAGQVPVDVAAIGAHAFTGTGRKWLRGPRGTGFLWVEPGLAARMVPPTPDMSSATLVGDPQGDHEIRPVDSARRFETSERSVANMLGLGTAVRSVLADGVPAVQKRLTERSAFLRTELAAHGHRVFEPVDSPVGITTFVPRDGDPNRVRTGLAERGVAVCKVYTANAPVDFTDRGLDVVVRVSPHVYNSDADVDRFLGAMSEIHPAH